MGVIVTFDYAQWRLRYPELAVTVTAPLAQDYFDEATLYLKNDGSGPVCNVIRQRLLLGMLTAHIAKLNAPLNGNPSPDLVGRISNASEGSVSVATDMELPKGSAQWYAQTKYGIAFWTATTQFRTAHYIGSPRQGAGARPGAGPWWGGLGGGNWW